MISERVSVFVFVVNLCSFAKKKAQNRVGPFNTHLPSHLLVGIFRNAFHSLDQPAKEHDDKDDEYNSYHEHYKRKKHGDDRQSSIHLGPPIDMHLSANRARSPLMSST